MDKVWFCLQLVQIKLIIDIPIILSLLSQTQITARDNENLLKPLSNRFDTPVCLNEYETKSENKNKTNEFRYFPESNFAGFNKLFVLVYPNRNADSRRFKT